MGQLPKGPRPIWARAYMGQGPYGPGPIWAPGPWAPGPSLLGEHLTKKTHPGKKSPNCVFCVFLGNKKDAGRPYDHFPLSFAPRSLLCVRKQRIPFYFFVSRKQTGWGPIGKKVPSWMGSLVLLVCTIYGVTPSQYSCDFWEGICNRGTGGCAILILSQTLT